MWLIVFSTFMLASLLSMIYVATGLRRESPPPDLEALRARLEPEATWTLRLQPFPNMLRELVAEPVGAKPDGRGRPRLIQRIENNAYPVAHVLLLSDSEEADDDAGDLNQWAVLVPLRRSQKLYAEPLKRALDQAREAVGDGAAATQAGEGRLILASTGAVAARVEQAWIDAGHADDPPATEGLAPLAFEGAASRVGRFVEEQLAEAIGVWPVNEDTLTADGVQLSLRWEDADSLADAEVEVLMTGPAGTMRSVAAAKKLTAPMPAGEQATLRWRVRGLAPLPPPDTPAIEEEGAPPAPARERVVSVVDGPEWLP